MLHRSHSSLRARDGSNLPLLPLQIPDAFGGAGTGDFAGDVTGGYSGA